MERHSQRRITESPVLTELDAMRKFRVCPVVVELLFALAELLHDVEFVVVLFRQVVLRPEGEGLAKHLNLLKPAASLQHSY